MSAADPRGIVEIACDESGFVGGSLFGGSRVFTHASLDVDAATALEVVAEVRRRTGADVRELKASRLNRAAARPVAAWLCGPDGPLSGRVAVHVTDARLFGLARLAQVVLSDAAPEGWWSAREDVETWEYAVRLDAVLADLVGARERALLLGARDLLWIRRRARLGSTVEAWAELVHAAAAAVSDSGTRQFLAAWGSPAAVRRAREYVASPPTSPLSEPLLPAVRWAVHHWSARGDVVVVHDEQSVLTPARVAAIADELAAAYPGRRLAAFTRVDSRDDARVQVADLVAGVVRRVLEDRRIGDGDGVDGSLEVSHLVAADSVILPTTWGAPFSGKVRANAMPPSTAS